LLDKPTANGEGEGRKRAPEPQPVQHRPGIFRRFIRFIGESWAELQSELRRLERRRQSLNRTAV